jgi:hypothetical protein
MFRGVLSRSVCLSHSDSYQALMNLALLETFAFSDDYCYLTIANFWMREL